MFGDPPSIAEMLDEACPLILAAWQRNERPHYLRVHRTLYEVVAEAKASEIARGNPVLLLGLEIIPSDVVPPNRAEVF
jgi:hypothetical protein